MSESVEIEIDGRRVVACKTISSVLADLQDKYEWARECFEECERERREYVRHLALAGEPRRKIAEGLGVSVEEVDAIVEQGVSGEQEA